MAAGHWSWDWSLENGGDSGDVSRNASECVLPWLEVLLLHWEAWGAPNHMGPRRRVLPAPEMPATQAMMKPALAMLSMATDSCC